MKNLKWKAEGYIITGVGEHDGIESEYYIRSNGNGTVSLTFPDNRSTAHFDTVLKAKRFAGRHWANLNEEYPDPVFNVYIETDYEESGDPELERVTYDEAEKYCKENYKLFKAGKFSPWGHGTLNPKEDHLLIACYQSGVPEYDADWFGIASYGKHKGVFCDYPVEKHPNKLY